MKKRQSVVQSFNSAIEGFIYTLKTQRNMRVHFILAVIVIIFGVWINLTKLELLILCAAITFVILTEMVNTAVEMTVDLVSESRYHSLASKIKDVTAGAVFVASINAIIVGYLLFTRYLPFSIESGLAKIRGSSWHIAFISLILVLFLVVMIKVLFHKGTPLRGGMPSGHAAMAFCIWMIISLLTKNGLVSILAFIMAFLIARSRLTKSIHSIWEVVAGSIVGALTALLVFQLLY